jgi:hypothetical protein
MLSNCPGFSAVNWLSIQHHSQRASTLHNAVVLSLRFYSHVGPFQLYISGYVADRERLSPHSVCRALNSTEDRWLAGTISRGRVPSRVRTVKLEEVFNCFISRVEAGLGWVIWRSKMKRGSRVGLCVQQTGAGRIGLGGQEQEQREL